ncbi:MAG: efflux RND transporter periplasmic adaptor subunit [Myxococcota bacterium]
MNTPIVFGLLAGGLLLAGCGNAEGGGKASTEALGVPEAPGTRVEVARIQPSQAFMELSLPGEIEGANDALLASAAGGFIEAVLVEEGQAVKKGQSLMRVNTSVYAAQLEQAEAQAEQAARDLQRTEALGDLASEAQLDGLRTQARVAASQARLARINLSRSVLKAPFSGVVSSVGSVKGEIANPSAPLVRVIQLDPVNVSIGVSDRDVVGLSQGLKASVSTESTAAVFDGTVTHIDPAADLSTRLFTVEVEVANPERALLPGMIAEVKITQSLADGAVVMPQDWLVTRRDGVGVYIDDNGVARWRDVTAGAVVSDQIVIREGLSVNDRVIINGHRSLADGDKLILTREGVCCENGRASFAKNQN